MCPTETLNSPVPEAEAAKIDRKIEEAARRISSGTQKPNDFSNVNDLVRQRANLLMPSILRKIREAG